MAIACVKLLKQVYEKDTLATQLTICAPSFKVVLFQIKKQLVDNSKFFNQSDSAQYYFKKVLISRSYFNF